MKLGGHPAIVHKPRGAIATYVMAHGAGAGMRHPFMEEVTDALGARKIATVRWEFPYMAAGKARPDPAPVAEAAVRAVWDALDDELPRFAGGKSFGGRMTVRAHAAQPLAKLVGLVFLGFPLHRPVKSGPEAEAGGALPTPAMDRAEHLSRTASPMLFLQGTRDDFAQPQLVRPAIAALGARATLHEVQHADHGFDVLVRSGRTHPDVIAELAGVIASWMEARIAACGRATRRGTRRS